MPNFSRKATKMTKNAALHVYSKPIADNLPVLNSTIVNTITDNQLNISCTVAAAKALRKFSLSAAWVIETIVLVTDVPIFEPKIIGIAFFTGAPADTNATEKIVKT